jgi:hypothetical protein
VLLCGVPDFSELSVRQKYSQIAQIVPGGSGLDRIAQRAKYRIGIEMLKRLARVQALFSDALDRASIHDCSGGGAVPINSIGAGA